MITPGERWFIRIKELIYTRQYVSVVLVGIFALSIPLTVFVVQQVQDNRQRAHEGSEKLPVMSQESAKYPWKFVKSKRKKLPVITAQTKSVLASVPFSSKACDKKAEGDADCNNRIDEADVSFWQIDYETGKATYADFNNDNIVDLQDFSIWRAHAAIPKTTTLQKISQNYWIPKILAFFQVKPSDFSFRAYADTSASEVVDSSVYASSGVYKILNAYANQSYSVAEIAADDTGKQTYYDSTGRPVAQTQNFLGDAATTVTRVGTDTVTLAHDPSGTVIQLMQDSSGAFLSSQAWPNQESYDRGDAPLGVTLPSSDGFVRLSTQPNNAGTVTQLDGNGKLTGILQIGDDGTVTYKKESMGLEVKTNKKAHLAITTIPNNLGGKTTYIIGFNLLRKVIETDSKKNTYESVPLTGDSSTPITWRMVTVDKDGNTSEKIVSDPMLAIGSKSPSAVELMKAIKPYTTTKITNPNITFSEAYSAVSSPTVNQAKAADAFVAVSDFTGNVLGAKTIAVNKVTKSVLGVNTSVNDPQGNTSGTVVGTMPNGSSLTYEGAVPTQDNSGYTYSYNYNGGFVNVSVSSWQGGSEMVSIGQVTVAKTDGEIISQSTIPEGPIGSINAAEQARDAVSASSPSNGQTTAPQVGNTQTATTVNTSGLSTNPAEAVQNALNAYNAATTNNQNPSHEALTEARGQLGGLTGSTHNAASAALDSLVGYSGHGTPNPQNAHAPTVNEIQGAIGRGGHSSLAGELAGAGFAPANGNSVQETLPGTQTGYTGPTSSATSQAIAEAVAAGNITQAEALSQLAEQHDITMNETGTGFSFTDGSGHSFSVSFNADGTLSGGNTNNEQGFSVNGTCVSGKCSFLAGTLIDTPRGQVSIEKLKEGDMIYSFDMKKKEKVQASFAKITQRETDAYLIINDRLRLTPGHIMYYLHNNKLEEIAANRLKVGDILYLEGNKTESIYSIVEKHKKVKVYNLFSVSPNNNFFADGYLSHNCGEDLAESLSVVSSTSSSTETSTEEAETATAESTESVNGEDNSGQNNEVSSEDVTEDSSDHSADSNSSQ